jgi:hypothetical protein
MRSLAKLAAVSAFGVAGAMLTVPAVAANWMYNGSKVSLEENGQKRRIVVVEPSASLSRAGAKRGAILFEGESKANGRLSGYAKTFKANCEPLDYFVEGTVDGAKGEMVLQGQAPVFASTGCNVQGYSEDSGASTLVFSSLDGGRGQYANQDDDPRLASRGDRGNTSRDDVEQGDGGYANRDQQEAPRTRQQSREEYANREPDANSRDQDNESRSNADDRRSRDSADRQAARDERDEGVDPRYDRSSPDDNADDDAEVETRTYRYRTYRRTYQPDWRQDGWR